MVYIPNSKATVDVQLINTTTNITIEASGFVSPGIPGHEYLHLPTFCFLIKHQSSESAILFDCGARTNWRDLPPNIVSVIAQADIHVEKNVDEILVEGGFALKNLNSIIWSHWHWDHVGDASRFHPNTEIVVGPSFKENFIPGYPVRQDAVLLESDFKDRKIREINFSDNLMIGDFRGYDYFKDGSLYLLDVPGVRLIFILLHFVEFTRHDYTSDNGWNIHSDPRSHMHSLTEPRQHAIGHMSALARTSHDTFILMAGDTCHFPGTFRPSCQVKLPEVVPACTRTKSTPPRTFSSSHFSCIHPCPDKASSTPFYQLSQEKGGWYVNPQAAQASVTSLQDFDGDKNVLVLIAHDPALLEIEHVFPNTNMNAWKELGWKERLAWSFLNELPLSDINIS